MKAILTTRLPTTLTKPTRIKAYDSDGNSFTTSAQPENTYAAHLAAAEALCNKMKWTIGPHSLKGGGTRNGYAFVFVEDQGPIQRRHVHTKGGNTLEFFYNAENDLLVVDLISSELPGGNELVRRTLDERKLLRHLRKQAG